MTGERERERERGEGSERAGASESYLRNSNSINTGLKARDT
jgi:hypothetical protein